MEATIARLLTRLFGAPEEINGGGICATYLYRWHVASARGWKLYVHRFVGNDWSGDLHDHPRRFVSIGLRGRYIEHTPSGPREYVAPWARSFPAEHRHRITLAPGAECWTLVIVCRITRRWGFWPDGRWMYWRDYVGSDRAQAHRDCV